MLVTSLCIYPVALNKLVAKLDKRADKAQKASPSAAKYTKTREESTFSTTSPPIDAPVWAVKTEYRDKNPTDNVDEEHLDLPQASTPADPSAVTPSSSRSSEEFHTPQRIILRNEELHQALSNFDSSFSEDSD